MRTNAFVQPIGSGWYRYHTLFAEMLRLKLRHEHPDRVVTLHQRAARWYERNGLLTDAVRHAAPAGDWPLAAAMVIDELAISQIIEPRGGRSLADEFAGMPPGEAWTGPQPYLVSAALALAAGRHESCAAALDAADGLLQRLPAERGGRVRLAAAMIRLTAGLRTGDLAAAAAAASRAELMLERGPGRKAGPAPDIRGGCCPAARPSSCGPAIWTRRPASSKAVAAAAAPGGEHERAGLPRAARAGGGLARPAGPRRGAGRPRRPWPPASTRPPG